MNRISLVGTLLGALLLGVLLMKGVQPNTVPFRVAEQRAALPAGVQKQVGNPIEGKPYSLTSHHGECSGDISSPKNRQIQKVDQPVNEYDSLKVKTQQTLLDWSISEPIAALSWLFSEEQDALRFKMVYPFERLDTVRKIFAVISDTQFSDALAVISSSNDDALLITALCAAISGVQPKLSREDILNNLSSYATSDEMEEHLRNTLLSEWVNSNPQWAQMWALQEQNSNNRDSAILAVAEPLLKSDPAAAIQWVKDNISNALWPSALESLTASWTEYDPSSVAIWLQIQIPSQEMDSAVRIFALKTRDIDPVSALSLASQIADENLRQEVVSEIQPTTL
jgi:hypothetical protein